MRARPWELSPAMANTNFQSVGEYLQTLSKPTQNALKKVRAILKKALPGSKEAISYQIPVLKLNDTMVMFFAGWKEHVSLYPVGPTVTEALGKKLDKYLASKGTLKFPLDESIPEKLIAQIAKLRAKDAAGRIAAKKKK